MPNTRGPPSRASGSPESFGVTLSCSHLTVFRGALISWANPALPIKSTLPSRKWAFTGVPTGNVCPVKNLQNPDVPSAKERPSIAAPTA